MSVGVLHFGPALDKVKATENHKILRWRIVINFLYK